MITALCPECAGRPADPLTEIVEHCFDHERALDRAGADDAQAAVSGTYPVHDEAGGAANRAWCDGLHRGAT